MSPLLGSLGGSSEYAFRGTLDDWPNDFSASLSSQDLTGISPTTTPVATLTVTGLNYKARVIVENPNITVRVLSEVNTNTGIGTTAVTDGRQVYALRRESDPALFIRDQSIIQLRLQPTSGTVNDFSKTYVGIATIGKRNATWIVGIRPIDETPNTITFNPLLDQELNAVVNSNTVTIGGLETGFSFPISATANQSGSTISLYKNGSLVSSGVGTVANGDQIYLSSQTPNSYETARTFTIQVGSVTTPWSFLTRAADSGIQPFSFIGFSSANLFSAEYISNQMTVSGADPGIGLTVRVSGPSAFYEIRTSGGSLRHIDPANPLAPNYWQSGISTAFTTDTIRVKINSASSPNYNTATVGILTVSDQSGSFIVTTRPTPIDTIPSAFTFTDLTNQVRGSVITSAPITLSGMIAGTNGTASITSSTAGISAQFSVNGGAWISSPGTANVAVGNTIALRMTTPNTATLDGVTSSSITFAVNGTDTTQNLAGGSGYLTINGSTSDTWTVGTAARTCPITSFTLTSPPAVQINSDNDITFTPAGYNTDCQMNVSVTSDSSLYNFIAVNGTPITATKTLTNVAPGSTVTLRVRASSSYVTSVTSTVTVSNASSGVTPQSSYSTNWVVTTTGDTTPASASLTSNLSTVEVGKPFTLTWASTNCTSVRSVSWSPTPPVSLNGSVSLNAPASVGNNTYTITLYANPFASNAFTGPTGLLSDANGYYVTATVTISVIDDTTPIFTPNNFTNLTGVPINTTQISDTIVISDISIPLDGTITGSTGASFYDAASPTGIILSKPLNSSDSITLKVNSSSSYLTTTTATLTVKNTLSPFDVKATKSFSVTTSDCTPTTTTVSFPSSLGSNYVTLNSYTNASYTNLNNNSVTTVQLLFDYSTSIVTSVGSYTEYWNAQAAGAGYFKFYSTTASLIAPNPQPDPVIITWDKIINIIYYAYTSSIQRLPTMTEVTNILFTEQPFGYNTATALFDKLVTDINVIPTNNAIIRSTTVPIYNSCFAAGGASNPIIKTGSYPLITAGTYPPNPATPYP